jgi:hypothetical protein
VFFKHCIHATDQGRASRRPKDAFPLPKALEPSLVMSLLTRTGKELNTTSCWGFLRLVEPPSKANSDHQSRSVKCSAVVVTKVRTC